MTAVRALPRGITFTLNDRPVTVDAPPAARLSRVLRDGIGLTGTKVGCDAGDCGACTVLLDGRQACACLVPFGQIEGRAVVTVEGLAADPRFARLQRSFLEEGATQCGICTPGMLMAAADLLARHERPDTAAIETALGGVLCRCTGYRQIVAAVARALEPEAPVRELEGPVVGARVTRLDGRARVEGTERYGADGVPADAWRLRVVRSPHGRARFRLGDLAAVERRFGIHVLGAADVPGVNSFAIFPDRRDQPVFAPGHVRYRGEAVLALVGPAEALARVRDTDLPIDWQPDEPVSFAAARQGRAPELHADRPGNVLTEGRLESGDVAAALEAAAVRAGIALETSFVEHAYIEPEAGWAVRKGDRLELTVSTQSPYMDRDEVASVLGVAPDQVRIRPTACGGGFGGKLDLAVHPYLAVAAWRLGRPVACTYSRIESMASTTKRHPAAITVQAGADAAGRITALDFQGDYDTGAYASWGPTVANRVPIHASGPYRVGALRARTRAILTNAPPSGAFRGFGVPQALLAVEQAYDELALQLGLDPLEFRLKNALRPGDATATGQQLESVGMAECLERLRPRWRELRASARPDGPVRRGVGIASVWYGCGNTGMSNPAWQRVSLLRDGRILFRNGVQDIGQGSSTIMPQILADALGVPLAAITATSADTDLTLDCGKTSASRQTFISGRATQLAGEALRAQILRLANAGPDARIEPGAGRLRVVEGGHERLIELAALPPVEGCDGDVALDARASFDPPATPVEDNRGEPYATYGFGAQIAAVAVDVELGTVKVERIVAAYDVGRAINPQQVEGQILGGVAQGLGLALMEEFIPGRTENLHDYLIATVGDVPEVEVHLVEALEPLGPFGAKGVGEHALIPTAPAIMNAIHHATGVRIPKVPALPHRVRAALEAAKGAAEELA